MISRCLKCEAIFDGIRCSCGWMSQKQKRPSNWYVPKEYKKGNMKVFNSNMLQISQILGRTREYIKRNIESTGGTLNDNGMSNANVASED